MSHEIRTPLNGVLGLARLLQDARARRRAGAASTWRHLVDAAEQLTGIVSDVLDLSKIEAGHLDIEHIAFDLHTLVRSTFETFALLGRERGLLMHCSIAPEVPQRVRGDPVRMRQILANYLGNALKFTQRGAVTVKLLARGSDRVRLEVHDTGPGIAPPLRERLFQPFAQADTSTTRRFGGTGPGPVDLPRARAAHGWRGGRGQRRPQRQLLLGRAGAAGRGGSAARGPGGHRLGRGGAAAGRPACAGGRGQRGEPADRRRDAAPAGGRGAGSARRRPRHRARCRRTPTCWARC